MKKELRTLGPKKSTIDKILSFSKSLSNVKIQKMSSKNAIHLN